MMRTQIQLTEDQYRRLKRWAGGLGISLSEAVRRCVEARLALDEASGGRAEAVREAMAVVGKYADPRRAQVARKHDEYLPEAFEE